MNILDLIFPKDLYCVSCGRPFPDPPGGGIALCDSCAQEIQWIPDRSGVSACAVYSGRAAELVREMKFRGKPWYADTLSAIMAAKYHTLADPETGELPAYDFLVSVPMNNMKKASRGYDQAELIAAGLSVRIGVPYLKKALIRVRDTDIMSSLSAEERKINLAGAFSAAPGVSDIIKGKKILLTDDVYTTGSTADACTEALLKAGAGSIEVFVFATGANIKNTNDTKDRPAVVESPSQLRAKGPT